MREKLVTNLGALVLEIRAINIIPQGLDNRIGKKNEIASNK